MFSEVPDQLGMAILSVTPENQLLWTFLMESFTLGIAKISVILENPVPPKPLYNSSNRNSSWKKATVGGFEKKFAEGNDFWKGFEFKRNSDRRNRGDYFCTSIEIERF